MNKQIIILLLTLVLLNGCSSKSSDNSIVFENTVASMKKNIVGTWQSSCIDTKDGYSKITTKIFDSNNTYISSISTFSGAECKFYEFNSTAKLKYTIGGLINNNIEIDFERYDEITYTLVHFKDNQLYIANNISDEGVRKSDFTNSEALSKVADIVIDVEDEKPPVKYENTVESMKENIVGTWQSDCIDTEDGYSKVTTKIFDSNNTYIISISKFSGSECKLYESNSTAKWKYTIGGLDNNNIEIDFEIEGEITYTLVHFIDNQLYIANNISAEGVRKSDFTNSEALSKVADIVIDVEDEKPPVKYENTVESMKENIVGTWKSDCIDTEDEYSKIATKIFDSNNTYISSITTFSGAECEFYEFNSTATSKYTIGGVDNDNIEIDFEIEGEITYTLVHFIDNQLYIANDINDTAEGVRETDFSKSEALTKIE